MKTEQSQIDLFEKQSISKLIWKFFIPAFGSFMITMAYNLTDRIFIGQGVGPHALAGIGAIMPFIMIQAAFASMLGVGGSVVLSMNLGKKNLREAKSVLTNSIILSLCFALLISLLGFFLSPYLLQKLELGEQAYTYAADYLQIILLGTVFNFLGYTLNHLTHSEGNPRIAMSFIIISLGINILLDYILIIVFDTGMKGAAYASVMAQILLTIMGIIHFTSKRAIVKLKYKYLSLKWNITKSIMSIGFVPFSSHIFSGIAVSLFNLELIKQGNDLTMGVFGIIMSISMFTTMSVVSVSRAMQPILSYHYGALNQLQVKQTLMTGIRMASVISIISFLILQIFPEQIIALFSDESYEFIRIGRTGISLYFFSLPVFGFTMIMVDYYQSTEKANLATLLNFARQLIIFIPVLYISSAEDGLNGVWLSNSVTEIIFATTLTILLGFELRRINKLILFQNLRASFSLK